jgi:hypothetical protein
VEYLIATAAVGGPLASAWNDCLDSTSFASHYTAPEFFEEKYFTGRNPFAVLAMRGEIVDGVVTGVRAGRDLICGAPGSPHICTRRDADLEQVGRALAAGLRAHAAGTSEFISTHAWTQIPGLHAAGFRARSYVVPLCTILLDLSKGKDALFKQCSETRRNKIRRAIKAGVQVTEMDVAADFDDYYQLYQHWCEFKHLAIQPYETQRAVFASKGNRLVLVARHEGRMVGVSTFRYRAPGMVEYAANVSRREETRVRQNDLLLWRGIEWSAEQGRFSLFSTAGSHFFLQKFGGAVHGTYGYSLDRTLLRHRHAMDRVRVGLSQAYKKLPPKMRSAAKRLLRRQGEAD